ncbi:hypothetical protein PENSPDRAFT_649581 [Peniophora sp. CONT]|nr:hypothetical protein PENSPDRAFT_649581 [Peniophora sp. CONT]
MDHFRSFNPIDVADSSSIDFEPNPGQIDPAQALVSLIPQLAMLPAPGPPAAQHAQQPTHFVGLVETTTDALRLIMAARQGIIPRITRRLNESERRSMIKSGAVFVFSVEESGIRRWTEGLAWSPSRIVGNFLVYREVTERAPRGSAEKTSATPGTTSFPVSSSRGSSQRRTRGDGSRSTDPSALRVNGLIKKTITVKVDGADHHLISYYRDEDIRHGRLLRPTSYPDIMALTIPPEMVRGTNFRHPPHIEYSPDGRAHIFDAEEADVRRQQPRSSASTSTSSSSRSSRGIPQPSLSIDTLGSSPPDGLPALTPAPSQSGYNAAYSRDQGALAATNQVDQRWSPPSALSTSPVDGYHRIDYRTAPQSSGSWQQTRQAYAPSLPSLAGVTSASGYYQSAAPERATTPSAPYTLPSTSAPTFGASASSLPDRPGTAIGWSRASNSPNLPAYSAAYLSSASDSAGSSPVYAHADVAQPAEYPTSYSSYSARVSAENPSYARNVDGGHPGWDYQSRAPPPE